MKIIDVTLNNFRKHRHRRIRFGAGVNAIIGKNTAGKTTILEAILFALTGALFEGSKESAISLGCNDGYVELNFQLNGKDGRITRHLEATRILLEYDGNIYRKATEVKEIWDKLLQVQPEFIENIITARQGRIHALFSNDDETFREKLFQKIFLVPPTEKIRSSIYRNYMKQCPPLLPVEDPAQLQTIKGDKVKEIATMEQQVPVSFCPKLEFELRTEKAHLERVCRQKGSIDLLLQRRENANQQLLKTNKTIAEIKEVLGSLDIVPYEQEVRRLKLEKEKDLRAKEIKTKIRSLPAYGENAYELLLAKKKELELTVMAKSHERRDILSEITALKKVCEKDIHGGNTCPVCKQDTSHLHKLLSDSEIELQEWESKLPEIEQAESIARRELNKVSYDAQTTFEVTTKLKTLEDELAKIGSVDDYSSLAEYEEIVENYKAYKNDLAENMEQAGELNTLVTSLTNQIGAAAVYTGEGKAEDRLYEVTQELEALEEIRIAERTYHTKLQIAKARVIELDERIEVALRDSEKNARRNRYMEAITRIYDGFHASNFPRKLVQSYTNAVSERFQEKLEAFDIPLEVRLNDKFETLLYDKEGHRVPAVSGGQKVLLGLSLHLALHDLFSQSFPLFMIDEGTTHLDADNVNKYFQLISTLKTDKKINQIIIIDHHPGLKEVVDHVIEL